MTTINSALTTAINAALLSEYGAALGRSMNFSSMNIAAGYLAAGAFAPATPAFTASMPSSGAAHVDLGDGYHLEINEANSEINIFDAQGDRTQIWGDPHVNVNGQHIGDFYGATTFELKNGTKITIGTEPWKGNPNAYVASQVTITRGEHALVIGGVSQNQLGDLSLSMSENGYQLDAATADGLVVNEKANGAGWTSSITGQDVTQSDFNLTKPGAEAALAFGQALSSALGGFLLSGMLGPLFSAASLEVAESAEAQPKPRENAFNLLAMTAFVSL